MQHRIWEKSKFFQILLLTFFIRSEREIAHNFEIHFCDFSHPYVDIFYWGMLIKLKNEDLSFVVSYFEAAYIVFSNILLF